LISGENDFQWLRQNQDQCGEHGVTATKDVANEKIGAESILSGQTER
jgi:hypothetical protein